MMSQEQLKVDYWSVIVKLSYSVANYVITAQQSSWSQITDCCFFFVISLESLGSLLAHFTDLQVKVRDLPRCVRVVEEVAVQDQASTLVLDCRWWEHLSNRILKFAPCHVDLSKQPSSLLPIKAVFPFSHYKIFVASYFTTLPPFFSLQWFRGGTKWNSQVRAVHAFENHSPVFYDLTSKKLSKAESGKTMCRDDPFS